ncbi:MAG: hypothetical protein EA426_13920 [Spirochaetaceae bacterium]|nr:MAG: hypothetical protein EA426_13920 [Spirochaetaceae bacterium]
MAETRKTIGLSDAIASAGAGRGTITDRRHISLGSEIPTESYSDQPKIVRTDDGAWLCCITTGSGHEGEGGQHVITMRSADRGATWSDPVDVERADGPEASYACMLNVPSGRVYCFYNHNTDNIREVDVDPRGVSGYEGPSPYPDGKVRRVDSLGRFVFKYSDDAGHSWSAERYEIGVRETEIDRTNVTGGKVRFFWNVSNPFVHDGAGYVSLYKVGGFGPGFFVRNEGVLLRSGNILTETDPAKIVWETLPDGEVGLRAPEGAGPISAEHSYATMSDGSIYSVYRTVDGYPACSYSRDGGRTWEPARYATYRDGRRIKNPRAANFAWRLSDGSYLYWFHNHGGPVVPELMKKDAGYPYENRNPVWLCWGREADGPDGRVIEWSEPEIVLYDDDPKIRMSYPDLIEQDGRIYLAETQKDIARVHEIDPEFLAILRTQFEIRAVSRRGLVANVEPTALPMTVPAPRIGKFLERDAGRADHGSRDLRAGFTIDLEFTLDDVADGGILYDTRTPDGRGVAVCLGANGRLTLSMSDGQTTGVATSDRGVVSAGKRHHAAIIVDGGPKVIVFVTDGRVNDGGAERQFGWSRFSPITQDVRGADELRLGVGLSGRIHALRVYDRALMVTEAIGNSRAHRMP